MISISWFGGDAISFFFTSVLSAHVRELTLLAMDAILALGLLGLAFRFAKVWLGVAMLTLSGELALHGAAMGDFSLPFRQYIILNNLLSFGLILLLAGATAAAWLQRRARRLRSAPTESAAFSAPSPGVSVSAH